MDNILRDYLAYVAEVDRCVQHLRSIHAESMCCRRGCSSCCTDINVPPLEWYAIEKRVGAGHAAAGNDKLDTCPFLEDNACGIYEMRPLICRIHGLPLAYPLEEYDERGTLIVRDPPAKHVLWCDLNFAGRDKFDPGFAEEGEVFDMVKHYQRLDGLNRRFIATVAGRKYVISSQVSLREAVP